MFPRCPGHAPACGGEFVRASVLSHDSPKDISADEGKGLSQIDIGGVQVNVLFLTFLLELSVSKHHVDSPAIFPESTLTFW